ncbi:MAG: FAD-dependent monooxygenase [Gammaproteobacteria bacterium]|nr:FAD-dependent monooxygenase [Gammaproteobacteria bacterium]
MIDRCDIAVLGAGPAGCIAAAGLVRLGFKVAMITAARRIETWEGISARAVETLRSAGLNTAISKLEGEVVRQAHWNGFSTAANRERIVNRLDFDEALQADVVAAGVSLYQARVKSYSAAMDGWDVVGQSSSGTVQLHAGYLIEARGRQAPLLGGVRTSGPASTALSQQWSLPQGAKGMTAVAGFPDGWAWFAAGHQHKATLQLLVSSAKGDLPQRKDLRQFYQHKLESISESVQWLANAQPVGAVSARGAATTITMLQSERNFLRVGDACVAVDPLSGHGIFEALGSGLAAVPVVNTIMRRPQDQETARTFFRDRAAHGFLRYARIGRDFYAQEKRWSDRPFWRARQGWPDNRRAHVSPLASKPEIVERPVVKDNFVALAEVVVTADHPRGVWQVAGVPLVPLLHLLRSGVSDTNTVAERFGRSLDDVSIARQWLRYRTLLP